MPYFVATLIICRLHAPPFGSVTEVPYPVTLGSNVLREASNHGVTRTRRNEVDCRVIRSPEALDFAIGTLSSKDKLAVVVLTRIQK